MRYADLIVRPPALQSPTPFSSRFSRTLDKSTRRTRGHFQGGEFGGHRTVFAPHRFPSRAGPSRLYTSTVTVASSGRSSWSVVSPRDGFGELPKSANDLGRFFTTLSGTSVRSRFTAGSSIAKVGPCRKSILCPPPLPGSSTARPATVGRWLTKQFLALEKSANRFRELRGRRTRSGGAPNLCRRPEHRRHQTWCAKQRQESASRSFHNDEAYQPWLEIVRGR